jgi:hypothetical protein
MGMGRRAFSLRQRKSCRRRLTMVVGLELLMWGVVLGWATAAFFCRIIRKRWLARRKR